MTKNAKKNQEEYREIGGGGKWKGNLIEGKWNSSIKWLEGGTWSGKGEWWGKVIDGTWEEGKGDWKSSGDGSGKWSGEGKLKSNVPGPKYVAIVVTVIGLISNGLVVGGIVAIMLLFIAVSVIGQRTTKGKWWGEGAWKDDGDFRILDMTEVWKLGHHEGKIKGIMKDHIPS